MFGQMAGMENPTEKTFKDHHIGYLKHILLIDAARTVSFEHTMASMYEAILSNLQSKEGLLSGFSDRQLNISTRELAIHVEMKDVSEQKGTMTISYVATGNSEQTGFETWFNNTFPKVEASRIQPEEEETDSQLPFKERVIGKENNFDMYHFSIDNEGDVGYTKSDVETKDIDDCVPELYMEQFDPWSLTEEFLDRDSNCLMFIGQPGTGKTTLMRFIMRCMAVMAGENSVVLDDVAYIKNDELFTNDQFINVLSKKDPELIILDDFDNGLECNPDGSRTSKVENLTSFTNGVAKRKTKFVITTNRNPENIDKAMTRDGRMMDILELKPMSANYARGVWIDVLGMEAADFDELFEGKEFVTQASLMERCHAIQTMGNFGQYLTDPECSVKHKFE